MFSEGTSRVCGRSLTLASMCFLYLFVPKSSNVAHRPMLIGVVDVIAFKYILYSIYINVFPILVISFRVIWSVLSNLCLCCRLCILPALVWTSVLSYGNDVKVHVLCNDVIVHVLCIVLIFKYILCKMILLIIYSV